MVFEKQQNSSAATFLAHPVRSKKMQNMQDMGTPLKDLPFGPPVFRITLDFCMCCAPFVGILAAQIIEAVDLTANPCEDFFQFACGSWNKKHIIPEDKTGYNPFEKLNDELQVILKSKPVSPCVTPTST